MNRLSDDSSRRIIPVQFWKLLHTFKPFFLKKTKTKQKNIYIFFYFFILKFFLEFLKTLLLDLTMKKQPKNPEEVTPA